jgi:hypothetical protein
VVTERLASVTRIPTLYARMHVCPTPCRWCGSVAECEHDECCDRCDMRIGVAVCGLDLDCPCHGPLVPTVKP